MRTVFMALLVAAAASGASAINCVSSGKVREKKGAHWGEKTDARPLPPVSHAHLPPPRSTRFHLTGGRPVRHLRQLCGLVLRQREQREKRRRKKRAKPADFSRARRRALNPGRRHLKKKKNVLPAPLPFFAQKDKIGDNPTDDQIKGYLSLAPQPSADCCTKVRPFIAAGCACDEDVLYMVGRSGVSRKTMGLLSRAVPMTACNGASYGAPIADGCKQA